MYILKISQCVKNGNKRICELEMAIKGTILAILGFETGNLRKNVKKYIVN